MSLAESVKLDVHGVENGYGLHRLEARAHGGELHNVAEEHRDVVHLLARGDGVVPSA